MIGNLERNSYVYSASRVVPDKYGLESDAVVSAQVNSVVNGRNKQECIERFVDVLRAYDPEASEIVSGIARALDNMRVLAHDRVVPTALFTLDRTNRMCALVGDLAVGDTSLRIAKRAGVNDGLGLQAAVEFDQRRHGVVEGYADEVPELCSTDDPILLGGAIQSLIFEPVEDRPRYWDVTSGFVDVLCAGDAVARTLERNGFGRLWETYQATEK